MKEATKAAKEKNRQIVENENRQYFFEYALKNKKVPNIVLNEDKEFNFNSFLNTLKNDYCKNFEDLIWAIYKTYINYQGVNNFDEAKEKEINEFLNFTAQDMTSNSFSRAKSIKLYEKFLNDFIYKNDYEKWHSFAKTEDCMMATFYLIDTRLTERMRNIKYFNFSQISHNNFIAKFKTYLEKAGNTTFLSLPNLVFDGRTDFMAMPKKEIDSNAYVQEFLIKSYIDFGKNLAIHYRENINGKNSIIKREDIEKDWELLKEAKISLENMLSEESKKRAEVADVIEKTNYLLNNDELFKFIDRCSYEGKHGDYYISVQEAIKNPTTKESQEIIKKFLRDMKKVTECLSYRDENGRSYPVNYFKVLRNNPSDTYMLINSCKEVVSSDEAKFLEEVRRLMKFSFGELNNTKVVIKHHSLSEKGNSVSVKNVARLLGIDSMTSYNNLDKEALSKIPEQVERVMKKENLPENLSCIKLVFQACLNGVPAVKMPPSFREKEKIR